MKEVPLTQGYVSIVDNEDYAMVSSRKWHTNRSAGGHLYAYDSGMNAMHKLIMNPAGGFEIDHKDLDGLNNQRSNLRECTHRQNICNRKIQKHSSVYKGVRWDPRLEQWRAEIRVFGRKIHLGLFQDEVIASQAYNDAAVRYQGEFARS